MLYGWQQQKRKRVHTVWDSNLRPPDYKTVYKSDALSLSYRINWFQSKKVLGWFAKHQAREYQERTTPSQIFMPCNLSFCRVGQIKIHQRMIVPMEELVKNVAFIVIIIKFDMIHGFTTKLLINYWEHLSLQLRQSWTELLNISVEQTKPRGRLLVVRVCGIVLSYPVCLLI